MNKIDPRNSKNPFHNVSSPSSNGKLPSLSLEPFNGNPQEISSFGDTFQVVVRKNDSLKKITKFNYLKSCLKGKVLSAISGISLNKANYQQAVELIQKQFGNKQILITSNIIQLLSILPVISISEI